MMKKATKSALALTLAALMLAGCSGNTSSSSTAPSSSTPAQSTDSTGGSSSSTTAPPSDAAPVEWSFFSDYAVGKDSPDDSYVKQQIESNFNVKIKFETYTGDDYAQALNLKVASGDIPDVFLCTTYQITQKFARQGVLAKVDPQVIYDNAPKMMEYVEQKDKDAWIFTQVDGENYGVPVVWPLGDHSRVNVIREDWLEKLGMSIPTNIDEFYEVLKAFRNNDPDGDGQKNTYGMGGYLPETTTENIWPGLFGMFGSHPNIYYLDENGKIGYGAIDPRTKEALETLNKWYQEDLIDPEFKVDTADSWLQKWVSGKQGYCASSYWWTSGPAAKYFSGKWYDPVIDANPNAKVTNFAPMTGPHGDSGVTQLVMELVIPTIGFGKQLESKPEVIERWLQVQDVLQSDPYWHVLMYDGEEGKTFTRNDDNSITYMDNFDTFDERSWYGANGAFSVCPNYDVYDPQVKDMTYVNAQRALAQGPMDVMKSYPLEADSQYKTNLQTIVSKAMVDFVTGARPLTDWDNYVNEWLQSGGQATLDEAQQVYDTVFSK